MCISVYLCVKYVYLCLNFVYLFVNCVFFFFSSIRRHTICYRDWSSDVCSSDLPQPLVDLDRPPWLKPDNIQADTERRGPAADRDQDLVAGELAPVRDLRDHRAVAAPAAGCGHAHAGDHGDSLALESGPQFGPGKGLLPRQQPLRSLQHRDLVAAEALECLRHLSADGPAAEHEQPPGKLLRAGDRPVVPRASLGQSRNRGDEGAAPRGQHDRAGRGEPPDLSAGGLHFDCPLSGQPARAADQLDALALQPAKLPVVPPAGGHVVALGEGGCRVEPACDGLSSARRPPRGSQHATWPDERLARDAAPVRALSAYQLPFRDGDAEAAISQPASGVLAGRPRADHHHGV